MTKKINQRYLTISLLQITILKHSIFKNEKFRVNAREWNVKHFPNQNRSIIQNWKEFVPRYRFHPPPRWNHKSL